MHFSSCETCRGSSISLMKWTWYVPRSHPIPSWLLVDPAFVICNYLLVCLNMWEIWTRKVKQIPSFCVIFDACNVSVCWNTPVQCSVQASRDKWAATAEDCTCSKIIDGEAEQSQDRPEQEWAAADGVVRINSKHITPNTKTTLT